MTRLYSPSKIARERAITESYELYENVCYYLVNEGYTDTVEGAEIMIANMNENAINYLKNIVMRARDALKERSKRKEREYKELMSRPHPTDFRRAVATGPWDEVRESYNYLSESYDAYDVIVSYLINEGYTDTIEGAETIAMSMSEDWMYGILNEIGPKGDMRYRQTTYKGRHGQSAKEYQDSRSDAGKRISGNSKVGPRGYVARGVRDEPVAPGERPNPYPLSQSEKEYNEYEQSERRRTAPHRRVGGPKGLPG